MREAILSALRRRGDLRAPVSIVALAVLYALLGVSALAVAFGATMFVWSRVGPYAAAVVGGLVTFAFAYVGLRVIDAIRNGGRNG